MPRRRSTTDQISEIQGRSARINDRAHSRVQNEAEERAQLLKEIEEWEASPKVKVRD